MLFTRTKSIRSSILNYRQTIESIVAAEWKNKPYTCDCQNSTHCDQDHSHVVTGDLHIIKNDLLRKLLEKGPTYREKNAINYDKVKQEIKSGISQCRNDWARIEKANPTYLDEWYHTVMGKVDTEIDLLSSKTPPKHVKKVLNDPTIKKELERLQEKYVFVPTDKASNNISIVCKQFYIHTILKELNIFDDESTSKTYVKVQQSTQSVIDVHKTKMEQWKIHLSEEQSRLPFMYWIPKMHKHPSKQRFIAASACCSTKEVSATITKCLKQIDSYHSHTARTIYHSCGINSYWIINNSSKVHDLINKSNERKDVENIATYDFSTLYTNIPHSKLKERMASVISKAYEGMDKKFISVYPTSAQWVNAPKATTKAYNKDGLIEMINFLIDTVYVTCGDSLVRQVIGIPMGTDCAPFLANLFLYSYEHEWMMEKKKSDIQLAKAFSRSTRYIDDLLTINNNGLMIQYMSEIYPEELELKHENSDDDQHASYLDLSIDVVNRELVTSLYDQRDEFLFKIVNFPDLSGNIPNTSSYGVFIAQTLRYARACAKYTDFNMRTLILKDQLVQQHLNENILIKNLIKWIQTCIKGKIINKYGYDIKKIQSDLKVIMFQNALVSKTS